MLASPSREEDRKCARDLADILATTLRIYTKTENPALLPHITSLQLWYERTMNDVRTKDYSKDDAFIHRLNSRMREAYDKIK